MATLIAHRLSEKKGVLQTAILALELLGLISTFVMLKKAISPRYLFNMVLFNLRELANSFTNFFSSPLYTCIIITSVVILIKTFSKCHHPTIDFLNIFQDEKYSDGLQAVDQNDEPPPQETLQHHEKEHTMPKRTNSAIAIETVMSFFSRYSHPVLEDNIPEDTPTVKDIEIDCVQKTSFPDISHLTEAREIKTNPLSPRTNSTTYTNVQEIVYDHENTTTIEELININQEDQGELLEDDSLEATWRAITGGGNNNKKKQELEKSETWPVTPEMEPLQPGVVSAQSIGSKDLLPSVAAAWKNLRKSLTFDDALSSFRRGGLRGDFSVSPEESNKRFDDFIKKIYYERMLQRQESDQRALRKNMLRRER